MYETTTGGHSWHVRLQNSLRVRGLRTTSVLASSPRRFLARPSVQCWPGRARLAFVSATFRRRWLSTTASPWRFTCNRPIARYCAVFCKECSGFAIHRLGYGWQASRASRRPARGWAGSLCSSCTMSWSSRSRCPERGARGIGLGGW